MADLNVLSDRALRNVERIVSDKSVAREVNVIPGDSNSTRHRNVPTPDWQPRKCCLLKSGFLIELFGFGGSLDPANLGFHKSSNEKNGIVYTAHAGFVDIGHVRDLGDLTYWVYSHIEDTTDATMRLATPHGFAEFSTSLPSQYWADVAGTISYLDALGYEIYTYHHRSPGMHHSAFSPEDLSSNYIGVFVAQRAIRSGGDFDRAFETELGGVLAELGVMSKSATQEAFDLAIKRQWIKDEVSPSLTYLMRRNLTGTIWQVGHPRDGTPTTLIKLAPLILSSIREFEFTFDHAGRNMTHLEFGVEITRIAKLAVKTYGANATYP